MYWIYIALNIYFLIIGKLYITGGLKFAWEGQTDVDVFDMDTGKTVSEVPMGHARYDHATAASTSALFVIGGFNTASCEVLNAATME